MDLSRSALIVVDLQEDFCPPSGALAVPGGRDIAGIINRLLHLPFALKVATQDWHPRDHVSFSSSHPHLAPFNSILVHNPANHDESEQITLWPAHCIQESPGADLLPELDISKIHHFVKKGQDKRVEMFSAFRDNFSSPCLTKTDLENRLNEALIATVYVVGLAANHCVKYTALDAIDAGFQTIMLQEATKAVDQSATAMQSLQQELTARGVQLLSIADSKLPIDAM